RAICRGFFMRAVSAGLYFLHRLVYPGLSLLVNLDDGAWVRTLGIDCRSDSYLYRTGALAPAVAWPELTGVVRHRHHRRVIGTGQGTSPAGELDRAARQHPGAFWEHQYPHAIPQALSADAVQLLQGATRLAAIDGDGFEQRVSPTEEGYV